MLLSTNICLTGPVFFARMWPKNKGSHRLEAGFDGAKGKATRSVQRRRKWCG